MTNIDSSTVYSSLITTKLEEDTAGGGGGGRWTEIKIKREREERTC